MAEQPTDVLSREEWMRLKAKERLNQVFPSHEGSGWSGIVLRPYNVSFATQNIGEDIFILLRRHWITNIDWALAAAFYMVIPFIIQLLLSLVNVNIVTTLGVKLLTLILVFYYSVVFSYVVKNFVEWYFNLYIVTDERVLELDFLPFSSQKVSETGLASVENVQETQIGFLPTVFNFGEVKVFTAAEQNVIIFEKVPNPTLVRDRIMDLAKIVREQEGDNS